MDDAYNNIDHYNPNKNRKILIVFDDVIADIMANKIFQAIIMQLFIRCRKLNISLVFIIQSYFSVPKEVRLNSTHYLTIKTDYKHFMKSYKKCISEPYSILTIDTTLPANNHLRFRKNLLDPL